MADLIERETLLSRIDYDEYYHSNEVRDMVKECPAVDAVPKAAYDQVVWERDMAIQQLREDYGVGLGEKKHADAVLVVRCKDCKNYVDAYGTGEMVCMRVIGGGNYSDPCDMFPLEVKMPCLGFCSYGERRNDDAAD